jgi:Ca-activated chloride channel family protein
VSEERAKDIQALGLKYNLLTKYTSFIAVREKIVNPSGAADNVDQPLPLPVGISDMAVGSEPDLVWLLVIALFGGVIVLLKRMQGRSCRLTAAS